MTTSIRVHVNGRYKATVKQSRANGPDEVTEVHGNYEGSPNPTGEKTFYLPHPARGVFDVSEEAVPETPAAS